MSTFEPIEIKDLVDIKIIVTYKNDKPAIEIRKSITNFDLIKTFISCAFHDRPIILLPQFPDKVKAINSLLEKGVIYKKENEYFFTL